MRPVCPSRECKDVIEESEENMFPAQMASNAESFSVWWRHHDKPTFQGMLTGTYLCCAPGCRELTYGNPELCIMLGAVTKQPVSVKLNLNSNLAYFLHAYHQAQLIKCFKISHRLPQYHKISNWLITQCQETNENANLFRPVFTNNWAQLGLNIANHPLANGTSHCKWQYIYPFLVKSIIAFYHAGGASHAQVSYDVGKTMHAVQCWYL